MAEFKLKVPGTFNLNSCPTGLESILKFPGIVDLNSRKKFKLFFLMDRYISSTKIDQKCAPDPMRWIPGPEICRKCKILEEIFKKLGLGTEFSVFELTFDRFRHF